MKIQVVTTVFYCAKCQSELNLSSCTNRRWWKFWDRGHYKHYPGHTYHGIGSGYHNKISYVEVPDLPRPWISLDEESPKDGTVCDTINSSTGFHTKLLKSASGGFWSGGGMWNGVITHWKASE